LLRWEAALAELRAFRRLPDDAVTRFAVDFAASVQERLGANLELEALSAPPPDRRPVAEPQSWDRVPTIFPFLLRRNGRYLSAAATERVYQRLRQFRCHVGQPVAAGHRGGRAVSALRLCLSSRLIVEAVSRGCPRRVIDRAHGVLDKAVVLAHALAD
jgi:hypothetical protein